MNKLTTTFFYVLLFIKCYILTGQELKLGLPLGHTQRVGIDNVHFSTDSQFIFSSSSDETILWETSTSKFLKNLETEFNLKIEGVSPNSKTPYAISIDSNNSNNIKVWNYVTGTLVKTLKGDYCKFSTDGKYLSIDSNNKTQIWDTSTFKLKIEFDGRLFCFANSDIIFIKNKDYKAYNIKTGELAYNLNKQLTEYESFKITKNKRLFFTLSKNKVLKFWRVSDGKLIDTCNLDNGIKNKISKIVLNDDASLFSVNYTNENFSILYKRDKRIEKLTRFKSSETLAIIKNTKNEDIIIQFNAKPYYGNHKDIGKYVIDYTYSIDGYNLNKKKIIYNIYNSFYERLCGFKLSPNQRYFLADGCTSSEYSPNSGSSKGFLIFDALTGKYLNSFYSEAYTIREAALSKNNQFLASVSRPSNTKIFDLSTGNLNSILETKFAVSSKFSTDNKYLEVKTDAKHIDTGSDIGLEEIRGDFFSIWDVDSGKLLNNLEDKDYNYRSYYDERPSVSISYKDSSIATIDKVIDGLSSPFKELKGHSAPIIKTIASSDRKIAATFSKDNTIKIWDMDSGKLLNSIKNDNSYISSALFNKDKKKLISIYNDKTKIIWDISTGRLLHHIKFDQNENKDKKWVDGVSNNTFKVIKSQKNNTLKVFNLKTNKLLHILDVHQDLITNYQFIPNTNFLFSSSYDGSIIFWNVKTGKELIRQFTFNDKDYLWLLPNGYYFASRKASSKLYYLNNLKTIGFDQLDVRYNRPDKVLEVLSKITSINNKPMIKAYKKAWHKRLKKLEIDTTSFKLGFSIPKSDFTNREKIAYEQNSSILKLHIKAVDSTYLLDRYNVWVNEVPVFGSKGISIKKLKTNFLNKKIKIKLSKGINKIETSVFNVNGIESSRLPLYVNYTPKKVINEKFYFVGIGVDRYQEKGHDLSYSVKDIKDLAIQFKEKYGKQIEIDTLFNQNVNLKNINNLKEKLKKSKVDDKVIISFSGHGMLSKDLDYYLATYNINFNSPELYGLPYHDLEYLLDGIPSRKKLLLIDACHSGEVDKDEIEAIKKVEKEKKGLKGTITVSTKKTSIGMKNSFELMKELFNNLDRATGATVISAAAGTQFAQERDNLKNGVFTYCILKLLKEEKNITVSELKTKVSKQVLEITNGLQQPTSRNETIENDWEF